MNGTLLIGILLVMGLVTLIAYVIGVYNLLVRLANNIDKAWSNIDVILKQRHDELPKLVEVCNSYMTHERETLEAVTKARNAYGAGQNIDDKAQAENQIVGALGETLCRGRAVSGPESQSGVLSRSTAHISTGKHHCRSTRVL
jgi:LemA protein